MYLQLSHAVRRHVRPFQRSRSQRHVTGLNFVGRREARKLPCKTALVEIGEVVAILDSQDTAEIVRQFFRAGHLHGRPDFAHRVEAALTFAMRPDDAVRALIAGAVQATFPVRARDALIQERPDEPARAHLALPQQLPVVP